MQRYEYKVIPAPQRGEKTRGLKKPVDRFANTLASVMNEMADDGWEYLRADTLPCEERSGLRGKTTKFQNMLVFRRVAGMVRDTAQPEAAVPAIEDHSVRTPAIEPRTDTTPKLRPPAHNSVKERLFANRKPASDGPRIAPVAGDKAPKVGPADDTPGNDGSKGFAAE